MCAVRSIHVLAIGQSNIANHGKPKSFSSFGRVLHDGAVLPMSDPVAGGSGNGGSVWPRVAQELSENPDIATFSLTLLAQGGTSISNWASGRCQAMLSDYLERRGPTQEHPTHVVFHQGGRDNFLKTETDEYLREFGKLYKAVDAAYPNISWVVCQASYRFGITSDDVRNAQQQVPALFENCKPGPDTDTLGPEFRHDNTHLNAKGLSEFAKMLAAHL